jgi:SAM-dependent methyltransferase
MINRKIEYIRMAAVEEQLWWYKSLHYLVFNYIFNSFSENSINIVDAGCGTGGMLKYLSKNGYKNIEGFDISIAAVEICKSRQLNVYLDSIINISTHYKPQSLDVIISNDTFYFINETERKTLIQDFHNLLRPNGLVILNLPALKAFRGIHDISVGVNYRFSKRDIKKMINPSHFKIIRATYWPFFLSPVIFITRFFQRIKLKINKNTKIESDIDLPSNIINNLLFKLTQIENKILYKKPFGSSLFLVLKKKV